MLEVFTLNKAGADDVGATALKKKIFFGPEVSVMSRHTENPMEFDLSHRQEERIETQLHNVFERGGALAIGESRADDKAAHAGTSHEMAVQTRIHSWGSYHKLQSQARVFCSYCWVNYGVRKIDQITPSMSRDFVQDLGARGYARNTIDCYASGVQKLAALVDRAFGGGSRRAETWGAAVSEVRGAVLRDAPDPSADARAYADPAAVVERIQEPAFHVVASLQLECGLRLSDACKLDELRQTGKIEQSKGGQAITPHLSAALKSALERLPAAELHPDKEKYAEALRGAAEAAGEQYTGTHGLRHNFAQAQFASYTEHGMSKAEALRAVAEDMGHHRSDITLTYLR